MAEGGRVLVTTLTKLVESLSTYFADAGIKSCYMHSDVDTLARIELIRDLRQGVFDVLVGINLLREELDIPECQMVAILDADKEGYLRSYTSLIQTMPRSRHIRSGHFICRSHYRIHAQSIGRNRTTPFGARCYNKQHGLCRPVRSPLQTTRMWTTTPLPIAPQMTCMTKWCRQAKT